MASKKAKKTAKKTAKKPAKKTPRRPPRAAVSSAANEAALECDFYDVVLDDRGPNTRKVCEIEQSCDQDCTRPTPYVVCSFGSKTSAQAKVAEFRNAGATAHLQCAP